MDGHPCGAHPLPDAVKAQIGNAAPARLGEDGARLAPVSGQDRGAGRHRTVQGDAGEALAQFGLVLHPRGDFLPDIAALAEIDAAELVPGDLVLLHTMNKTLAYKMVDSEVVLPEEMESLTIEPGADKVTLVTCTPYGVNDHRLLVHCVRTKYNKKDVDKQKSLAGRHWGKREFAVLIVVVAIVLLLLDIVIHAVRKRRKAKASA
mgnify:CR=1 FL=1